jgi:phospholipid/cholesterol/gamma-HCH transport system permease protein
MVNNGLTNLCNISVCFPSPDNLMVKFSGRWMLGSELPETALVFKPLEADRRIELISFDSEDLVSWDTSILTFLIKILNECSRRKLRIEMDGLPEGVQRLLKLASAVPPKDSDKKSEQPFFLERVGVYTLSCFSSVKEPLSFIGETFLAFIRFITGSASYRRTDLFIFLQDCGAKALPIVTLISVLIGLILAFVGAVQLEMFGAQIYVANLVGLGMAREMGAMMTGIIMAGRTGAAFAAQIGTMQVNEEIDALKTMGISPMDFLVMPRMIALIVMMPLLCLYANFMGILGGMFVGMTMLDISFAQYLEQTRSAIDMTDFSLGLVKSIVFGIIVAMSGCLRGIQCGRSSTAVGNAATSAVVTGIVMIVIFDSLLTVIYSILGI